MLELVDKLARISAVNQYCLSQRFDPTIGRVLAFFILVLITTSMYNNKNSFYNPPKETEYNSWTLGRVEFLAGNQQDTIIYHIFQF